MENERHTWNLGDIYPTAEAWRRAVDQLEPRLGELGGRAGTLGESSAALLACLDLYFEFHKQVHRVHAWASMLSDGDTRQPGPLEMRQRAAVLATRLGEAASFMAPEILVVGEERVRQLLAAEPALAVYRHHLEDILRRAPHTLGGEAESVIASSGLLADSAHGLYSILADADMPRPTVTLSDGSQAHLDQAGYCRHRSAPGRDDRRLVFDAFFGSWKAFERTCGVALYSQLKQDLFFARARRYPSCLAAALDDDRVPEAVYLALLDAARTNLGTLHRYLGLRARMLGVDDLAYWDTYPPLVGSPCSYPVDHGQRLVLEACRPLGEGYVATVQQGFAERWMDTFPRPGKRSGAYSSGSVYDVHPFVLLNYNDDYESVSTLAHEWGHAMHSLLANRAQPYPTAHYPIFLAEVASTFNEALLLEHALATSREPRERLFYLGSALEGLRGTFFRQAMFAEFELAIHGLVEGGEALSGERFSELYGELLRRYHGHDQGVMTIADAFAVEWAYIPHFYYDFYVYQYATSLAAASLFADQVLSGDATARERYLGVLGSGGAEYPYEMLRDAGVDLATAAPYQALMARMNRIMDEIEATLESGEA